MDLLSVIHLMTSLAIRMAPLAIIYLTPAAATDVTLASRTPPRTARWPADSGLARRTGHKVAALDFRDHHPTLGTAHSLAGLNHGPQPCLRLDFIVLSLNVGLVLFAAFIFIVDYLTRDTIGLITNQAIKGFNFPD